MGRLGKSVLIKKGKVSIEGLDEVVRTLKDLAGEKADGKLKQAMKFALKPLSERVKALAPKKRRGDKNHLKATTGLLKRAIGLKAKKYGRGRNKKVVGMVGPRFITGTNANGRRVIPAFYAHLVERGAAAHTVSPRAKEKQKSFQGPQMPGRFKSWTHPGAAAKAFMAPALQAVGPEIFERFAAKVKEILSTLGGKKGKGGK